MEARDGNTHMTELQKCLELLDAKGYTDEYEVKDGKLHNFTSEKMYAPQDITAVNFYRFEGASNPDDMSILYAIETRDGRKGTVIDAYGAYADAKIGEFMKLVETHKSVHEEKMY